MRETRALVASGSRERESGSLRHAAFGSCFMPP